jgi:bacteriocin-like protein
MAKEENKKQEKLNDEQLDNVSGGVKPNRTGQKKSDFNPKLP